MADNTTLNVGVGGDVVATDDIGGVKHQRVKIEIGADGAAADVHSGNPLPVTGTVAVTGPLTDTELRATAVPVSGTVTASGPLTDTQLRATAVPVSGTVTATGPLTDTQLRATAVPVSGTVTASGPLTDTQLRATAVPVSGTVTAGQGTAAGAAGAWPVQFTDGANLITAGDNGNNAVRVNIVAGAGSGGTAMTDDQAFTPNSTAVTPVAGTYRSTRDQVDNNDAGALAMTQYRALLVSHETPNGDSMVDEVNDALKVNLVAGGGAGGTAMTDDGAFTPGTTSVTPAAGYYLAARDSVNDGDAGALAMTAKRAVLTCLETPNGDSAMDETNDAVRVNIIAGAGSGGTAMVDDQAFTPATTSITPVGGTYRAVRDAVDSGDAGAFAMTASRAVLAALETPNGDSAMDDVNDAVRVNIIAGAGSGGTAITDDSAFTVGSTSVTPAAGIYKIARDSVDDGDAGALAMTVKRAVIVCPETPDGDSLVDDANDAIKIVGATGTLALDATLTGGTAKAILRGAAKGSTPAADVTVEENGANQNALTVNDVTIRNCLNGGGTSLDVTLASGSTVAVSTITTSVTPGTGRTNLGKAVDAAANSGGNDTGVATLMVRKDMLAPLTPTDGDYAQPLLTDRGAQWVKHDGEVTINALTSSDVVTVTGGAGQTADVKVTLDSEAVVLGSGSSTIGKLDANSGVVIGDVNILTGTGATNLAKAVDSVAGATDTGVATLAVRDDSLTTLTPADGDYVPLRVNSQGALHVTGGGGGTEYTVDVAAPTAPTGGAVLAERDDALTALTEIEGDWTNLRANANGALWVTHDGTIPVTDNAGSLTVDDGGTSLTVDGTVAVSGSVAVTGPLTDTQLRATPFAVNATITTVTPGTSATQLGKAEDAAHAGGDVGVMALAVRNDTRGTLVSSNGDYTPLQVNSSGDLRVEFASGSLDTELPAAAALSDTLTLPDVPAVGAAAILFNGISTYQRHRCVINNMNSDGTGVASAGMMAQLDDTTPSSVTENNFAPLRMSSRRALLVEGVTSGTAVAVSGTVTVGSITAGDNNIGNVDVVTLPALPAGTNNIGDVDVLTLPALPAGTNNIGDVDIASDLPHEATVDTITAKLATDAIQNGTTACTPKFAPIAASTSGNNTLVAAVTGKKIRVLSLHLSSNGTVNGKFQSGASGTDLTGLTYMCQFSGIVLAFNPVGHFETAANTLLNLNLSAAIAVGGSLTYIEV